MPGSEAAAQGRQAWTTHNAPGSLLPSWLEPTTAALEGHNGSLLEAWLRDAEARGLAPGTLRAYHRSLRGFVAWLGHSNILGVGHRDLHAYFGHLQAARGVSDASLDPHANALSSLYDYLDYAGRVDANPVPSFRRRYLALRLREANKRRFQRRPCLSVGEVRRLVRSLSDAQERLLVVLAAKTGVRAGELVAIDVADVDWRLQSIRLKPNRKRTHLVAFFDAETARLMRKWLTVRSHWTPDAQGPLFLGESGRMTTTKAGAIVVRAARRLGLHSPGSGSGQRLTLHAFRHWFTTHLRRAGMSREHIKVLRGDALPETMDIYLHIDYQELRAEYLRCMPQIAGDPAPPREHVREHRTANPVYGGLTALEASRPRRLQPKQETLTLRRRIADDLARGRLQRPVEYARWWQAKTGQSPRAVENLVRRQLRALGVPSLQRGPRGKGWKQARKELAPRRDLKGRKENAPAAPLDIPPATPKAPSRGPGRPPGAETVKLRETLQADQAASALQPRAAYLAILGAGKTRTRKAADVILSREAKRILGRPFGADPAPAPPAPVVLRKGGRQPSAPTVVSREKLQADAGGGKARDEGHHVRRLIAKLKAKVKEARPLVWRELRPVRH